MFIIPMKYIWCKNYCDLWVQNSTQNSVNVAEEDGKSVKIFKSISFCLFAGILKPGVSWVQTKAKSLR